LPCLPVEEATLKYPPVSCYCNPVKLNAVMKNDGRKERFKGIQEGGKEGRGGGYDHHAAPVTEEDQPPLYVYCVADHLIT
jgi:hypothetical protein